MSDRPSEALKVAVAAIYFADSSDYLSALWNVVRALSPDMAKLLEENESKAYQESQALQSIADLDGYTEVPEPRNYQPKWVCLEGMSRDELAAYDYGASSAEAAVKRILDGGDYGEGSTNEPWNTLRQRLLYLVASNGMMESALREAEAGLDFAKAFKPQKTQGFVPSHIKALEIVQNALKALSGPTNPLLIHALQTNLHLAQAKKIMKDLVEEQRLRGIFYPAHSKAMQFLGMCEDEGCPHYGTPHGHKEN